MEEVPRELTRLPLRHRGSIPKNAPAYNVFAQISTDLHGALHTNSQFGDRQDWIEILEFNHSVTSPRDAASGLSTGRRQHQPIVITKLIDGASPQLFEALARNETVTLTLEFERPGDGGVPQTYYKIVATGGAVSGIRQNAGTVNFDTETISITYQTITVENLLDNTQAQDDWLQQF